MPGHVCGRCTQSDSARYRTRPYGADADDMHIGATCLIRLKRPCGLLSNYFDHLLERFCIYGKKVGKAEGIGEAKKRPKLKFDYF